MGRIKEPALLTEAVEACSSTTLVTIIAVLTLDSAGNQAQARLFLTFARTAKLPFSSIPLHQALLSSTSGISACKSLIGKSALISSIWNCSASLMRPM